MKEKYVLKNKKRFTAFIAIVTVIAALLVSGTNAYGYKEAKYEKVTVRSGDTLWSIADKYMDQGDQRENVYAIQKANNMSDTMLVCGEVIKVPVL